MAGSTPTTNVPGVTFGPNGFISPSESAVLTGVQEDYNAAFGGNLNPSLSTPQGQLASSTAALIGQANDTFQLFTTQTDPAFAAGRMQDAIGRIYFIERNAALPSTVNLDCSGLPGTVIPVGAQASDNNGNIFACTLAGQIPSSGLITLPFSCTVSGPIAAPAQTIVNIVQAIPGWSSVFQASDAELGTDVESRSQFETRRQQSVSQNAAGALPNILGAILTLPNVIDAYVIENATNGTLTVVGGTLPILNFNVTLQPHSIYVAVAGGDQQQIANTLWSKKAAGCGYTGNTTVTVYDSNSGYSPPFPSYPVSFDIPVAYPMFCSVTLISNPQIPSNANALIAAQWVSAVAGNDGGTRARIGSEVLASRFIPSIQSLGSWVQIKSLTIGGPNDSDCAIFSGTITNGTLTVSALLNGTIGIGSFMLSITGSGTATLVGVYITSQLTGSAGKTGNYTVSNPNLTIPPGQIVTIPPTQSAVQVPISSVPTTDTNSTTTTVVAS